MARERTLSIVKPDATRRDLVGKIVARFEQEGLRIAAIRQPCPSGSGSPRPAMERRSRSSPTSEP